MTIKEKEFDIAAGILAEVRVKVVSDTNVVWTSYNSANDLSMELDRQIQRLRKCDYHTLEKIYLDFQPTSIFQDLSLSNGWGDEYIEIASRFDKTYKRIVSLNYFRPINRPWWQIFV